MSRDPVASSPTPGADSRPWWMTTLAIICGAAFLIGVLRDVFVAESRAVEVWLGFEVTGRAALFTAPLHWAIFAIGAWGFWTGRAWIVPWAAAYLFYAALSHLVWSEASPHGRGWLIGLGQASAFSAVGLLLLHAGAQLRARAAGRDER